MSLDYDTIVRLLLSSRLDILAYIRAIVRDYDLAEDVFQETSMVALAKRKTIRDEAHFAGWIRQAARLESLSALRRRRGLPKPLSDTAIDLLDSTWEDPEHPERIEALRACLGQLTERSQRIVQLRYNQGMKGAELAEVLGRSLNTVYVALSRIHRALADCVRKQTAMEGGSRA